MPALRLPVFVLMLGLLALAMLLPAAYAALAGEWRVARGFLHSAIFSGVAAGLIGLARGPQRGRAATVRDELLALLTCWVFLPVFAAVPLMLLTPAIGWAGAIFEMTAALTTTGGTVYGEPARVPDAVHLWRGLVGWTGGFLSLTAAWVVLAPRRLGGFEIEAATWRMRGQEGPRDHLLGISPAPLSQRIRRALRVILPIYAGLTFALGILLGATGQAPLAAAVHAMSVLSTSGISPGSEGFGTPLNPAAEAFALLFMLTAATRSVYSGSSAFGGRVPVSRDPELWTFAGFVALVSAGLFLRHWIGALTIDLGAEPLLAGEALWGTVFTSASFLTTTGFVSGYWSAARDWSGLAEPGLILLGLAAIGGGAATTAGGIKLIRAYALIRHGKREIERLAEPYSVLGHGMRTRTLLREGPLIVWTFIMLFIFAILAAVLALTAMRLDLATAIIAAIAAISNTGPAFDLVEATDRSFADFSDPQRAVLMAAMIVGRIETLALIALFNPEAWRRPRDGRQERGGKSPRRTPH